MGNEYLRNFEYGSTWTVVDVLAPIILSNVKGSIIEIGMGNSTTMLMKHAIRYKRIHMSCDSSDRIIDRVKNTIDKNKLNDEKHWIYQCKSIYFIDQLKELYSTNENNIDYLPAIVFIDGNHFHENTMVEVKYFLDILPQNAVMFLHDTYPQKHYYERKIAVGKKCDTYKTRHYLEDRDDIFTFTWPYTASYCGLTMVTKKDLDRPYRRIYG